MHLVLRASCARGGWSFRQPKNFQAINRLLQKFAQKYSVRIHSHAINFNHLHVHLQLANLAAYKPFIRALTAAIAMAVTKCSRWKPAKGKFWDRRPFTRIAYGAPAFKRLSKYIRINQLEGEGWGRGTAELAVKKRAGDFSILRNFHGWVRI